MVSERRANRLTDEPIGRPAPVGWVIRLLTFR
jgi:hypothetical protein